jgi:hypothetical protein
MIDDVLIDLGLLIYFNSGSLDRAFSKLVRAVDFRKGAFTDEVLVFKYVGLGH